MNPVFWLATRAISVRGRSRKKKLSFSNVGLTALVGSRWLAWIFILTSVISAFWLTSTSRSINILPKQEIGQYPAILSSRLVNNVYWVVIQKLADFFWQIFRHDNREFTDVTNDVFERLISTGSGLFAPFGRDLEQILGQIVSIRVKILRNTNLVASRQIKREKSSLPVDVRLLKNVAS